jgi:transcriptional regulator with XRE-family HTH domain
MGLQQVFMANMKKYRKQAGLTQEKLADFCNTDPCYIRQIEGGRRFPSLTYIERIASALSIAPYRLFYDGSEAENEHIADLLCREQKGKIKALLTGSISRLCAMIDEC